MDLEFRKETLQRTWQSPRGLAALTAVNQQVVGKRYIITAFAFFGMAVVLALTMLTQLARAENNVLTPEQYNQFFTMHGTTMMFLFAVPLVEGLGIYLVPMMIGARDMVFPRLNTFGYFVYVLAGITLFASLVAGQAPNAGWFNYVPLAGPEYSPGLNIDFYATAVTFLEISALTAAIELIVTILKVRAPGMSLNRMPIFVWSILAISFMIVLALPPLVVGSMLLALDRLIGTRFYDVALGGNSFLWQHFFWWFGHPEVYIIAVPAFGIASTIIPTFSRRPLVAYLPVALALAVIALVSFGLWVHHMFAGGLSLLGMSFFTAASMAISIPSGVQVFAWIGTIWENRGLSWKTPMLWIVGFIPLFVIGGITGVMVASMPFDWQVHDSYFVTAHFHYVLLGGAVFPFIGAVYYWFPKATGRLLGERLGRWSFWLSFLGFNVAFFVMHLTGMEGMPRRVSTYMADRGWQSNMTISTIGAYLLGLGLFLTLINVILSALRGERAGDNPWNAPTLEWSTPSPPPMYNFAVTPTVKSRHPLWDQAPDDLGQDIYDLRDDRREMIGTTPLDARPEQRVLVSSPSVWPLVLAVAVGIVFIGSMYSLLFVPIGAVLAAVAIIGWAYPGSRHHRELKP